MSEITYIRLYKEVEEDLRSLLPIDIQLTTSKPIRDRLSGFKWIAKHYIRYINIMNKLGLCYDQLTDPLKLEIMRKLLDASVGRVLELKSEMVREELTDFQYLDPILCELKITKHDIEIHVPRYYRIDRREELQKMNENIDKILRDLEDAALKEIEPSKSIIQESGEIPKKEEQINEEKAKRQSASPEKKRRLTSLVVVEPVIVKPAIPPEKQEFINIIKLIQRHERARKARLIARKVYEFKRLQDDIAWHRYEPIPPNVMSKAAKNINRFWRGYSARLRLKARDTRLRILIGEIKSSYVITPQKWAIEKVEEARRRCRKEAANAWDKAIVDAKARLNNSQQQEDIGDEIRFFILNWFRIVGELPMFPDEDMILPPPGLLGLPKGCPADWINKTCPPVEPIWQDMYLNGSALIVAGFWISPELYELAYTATVVEKKKNAGKKPAPKPTKEQIKQKKMEEKEQALELKLKMEAELAEKRSNGVYPINSCFLDEFKDRLEDSRLEWRVDEPISERAGLQVMRDVHLDIRESIDDRMREELSRLQKALDIDRSRKTKPEKPKKKKKKGKKKIKDLTKNRTLESLFEELVQKGVIKKYPYVNIDEIFCDEAYCNAELRDEPLFQDPFPKLGDLRQVIKEYCVLNVMGPRVPPVTGPRGTTPAAIRSVLLCGPRNSGKRLLVDGVCTLLGAVKFDITPSNLKGKFDGKKDKKMLVHLISKVSRLLQPSVIFIHGGEKPFFTKVPKDQKEDNPRLLKKDLPKLMREIKPEDRILFLATSDAPWMGAANSMAKVYDKILPVPNPDYGTRYQFFYSKLMAYHGIDRDFPTSVIARMSQGYTLPVLDDSIKAVLTTRRIILLKPKPLSPMEIYEYLLTRKEEKITPEEEQKYTEWFNRTYPLAVKRQAKLAADNEVRLKMQGDKKNK